MVHLRTAWRELSWPEDDVLVLACNHEVSAFLIPMFEVRYQLWVEGETKHENKNGTY